MNASPERQQNRASDSLLCRLRWAETLIIGHFAGRLVPMPQTRMLLFSQRGISVFGVASCKRVTLD
jgi:hypothetical protein